MVLYTDRDPGASRVRSPERGRGWPCAAAGPRHPGPCEGTQQSISRGSTLRQGVDADRKL